MDRFTCTPSTLLEQNRMASESLLHSRTDLLCGLNQETSWLFRIFCIISNIVLNYKEYIISKLYVGSTVEIFAKIARRVMKLGGLCFVSICKQRWSILLVKEDNWACEKLLSTGVVDFLFIMSYYCLTWVFQLEDISNQRNIRVTFRPCLTQTKCSTKYWKPFVGLVHEPHILSQKSRIYAKTHLFRFNLMWTDWQG